VNFIGNFEKLICHEAERRQVNGIICGHIHHAAMRQFNDVEYKNTGDWVESCTALIEHDDGVFQILHWSERQSVLDEEPREHGDNTTLGENPPKAA
jgi:UDP-2,3-diacylglucosamine pyrophosphatase LpxH